MDQAGKIEISGNEFKLVDWSVRVGTAVQGTTVKGVLVEVEFDPSVILVQVRDMMAEFIKTIFNRYVSCFIRPLVEYIHFSMNHSQKSS